MNTLYKDHILNLMLTTTNMTWKMRYCQATNTLNSHRYFTTVKALCVFRLALPDIKKSFSDQDGHVLIKEENGMYAYCIKL